MKKSIWAMFLGLVVVGSQSVYGAEVSGYNYLVSNLNGVETTDCVVNIDEQDMKVQEGMAIIDKIQNGLGTQDDYVKLNEILVELKQIHDNHSVDKELVYGNADTELNNPGCYLCNKEGYILQYGEDAFSIYRLYELCETCLELISQK